MNIRVLVASLAFFMLFSCENVDICVPQENESPEEEHELLPEEVARMLGSLPLGMEQIAEVRDAVSASVANGYDEEYMLRDLFRTPGAGVGDEQLDTKSARSYGSPIRALIKEHLENSSNTKSSISVDEYIHVLEESGLQIYWPFSETCDPELLPVITFAPSDMYAESNKGWMLSDEDGERVVREVLVDEAMAMERPVWVVNMNDDSGYKSLEMLRRADPEWGQGNGGSISIETKSGESSLKTLVLKDFTMKRNFDSWFAGASEFFVKTGSVKDFKASSEEELLLYSPTVTDFMIVVRRKDVNRAVPFNAVLVSEWTEQLTQCAFMIIEDDGGSQETWKCSAAVKYNSKSYGFDISIPYHSRDDIVWRGQLSYRYITENSDIVGHFGDVDLVFEVLEK